MEAEFEEIDRVGSWASVYQQIKNHCNRFDYSYQEAKKSQNKNLNRYRDVSPYDHSRVTLANGECDYINASLVRVPDARRSYILTQGPLPHTTSHFWLMVWEQKTKAVLMLNRVIEKNAVKCHQYWPMGRQLGGEDLLVLPDVGLKVEFVCETEYSFYTVRQLKITHVQSGESRVVLHFHYTTWPDFGVPQSPGAFLTFLLAVRKMGVLEENVGPAVVHCSAGIGRSGTFCLVDSCLVLIEKLGDMNRIKIQDVLLEMRQYRMGLIQTPDQLRFSYLAIIEGAKQLLTRNNVINNSQNCDVRGIVDGENNSIADSSDPPLLPAKSQTLDSGHVHKDTTQCSADDSTGTNTPESPGNSISDNSSKSISSEAELRRRLRQEKFAKTKETIEAMKKKQEASERRRRHRSLLTPVSIGLFLLLGSGFLVYRYLYRS